MILTGHRGELRVGYQVAARISKPRLVREGKAAPWKLEGDIVETDAFWVGRGPFELHVYVEQDRPWKWKSVSPEIQGGRVSAVVEGYPEK